MTDPSAPTDPLANQSEQDSNEDRSEARASSIAELHAAHSLPGHSRIADRPGLRWVRPSELATVIATVTVERGFSARKRADYLVHEARANGENYLRAALQRRGSLLATHGEARDLHDHTREQISPHAR